MRYLRSELQFTQIEFISNLIAVSRPLRTYSSASSSETATLLPSVQVLLHTHNISIDQIKPTGPKNNILKSDVLAAIGSIPESVPATQAEQAAKLSHLDLSNIVLATPPPAKQDAAAKVEELEQEEELLPLSIPISLAPLLALQEKMNGALGTAPSLSTLIARAISMANTALPSAKTGPSADELFNELISTSSASSHANKVSNGKYVPLLANSMELPLSEFDSPQEDIYDILTSPTASRSTKRSMPFISEVSSSQSGSINVFALVVPPAEEKRALTFLGRLRDVLEATPGKLIGL
jgi:hypothetical protein